MTNSTPPPTAAAPVAPPTTAMYATPPPPAPAANPASNPVTPMASKPAGASAPRAPAPVAHTMNATTAPASSSYTVQKGDSLMRIAAKTLGSKERWTEIRDVNHGLDPHSLHVGQKLVIPASAKAGADAKHVVPAKKSATAPASEKPASGSTDTYLVKKGDTLKSIAERHLGSRERWKEIASANPKVDPALAAATPHEIASGHPHVR
jgi:nucleoid-associated protein YgaU